MTPRASVLSVLMTVTASASLWAQPEVPVAVNQPITLVAPVTPGSTSVTLPFGVSGYQGMRLDAIVPVPAARFSLRDPSGTLVFTPGDVNVEFTSGETLTGSPALPGGIFATPEIPAPANGTWTIEIEFPAASERTVVLATVLARSATEVGLVLERESYVTGEDIAIGILALRNGTPIGAGAMVTGPTIAVRRIAGGALPTTATAFDDGADADGLAGDGIYSVGYTFAQAGTYEVTGSLSALTDDGLVQRTMTRRVEVRDRGLVVSGTGTTILTGTNGCAQGIRLRLDSTVTAATTYLGTATLQAVNGRQTTATTTQALGVGARLIDFTFGVDQLRNDLGVDGPYQVTNVQLVQSVGDDISLTHRSVDAGPTVAFSLAAGCISPVTVQAELTVTPTIVNGFISSVTLGFPVTVSASGTYSVSFKVIDVSGQDIDLLGQSRALSAGRNNLTFTIPGARFLRSDGPYSVISLLVVGPAGSASLGQVGMTPAWRRWQFTPQVSGDLDNDGDVDAADQAIVVAARNTPALNPGDRRDVVRDGIIDVRDARKIVTMACGAGSCP